MKFIKNYFYGGWKNCLYLSNNTIDLVVTTDVGPRIIRFGFANKKNLLLEIEEDMGKTGGDDYRLYGGVRLWHSPEVNPRIYIPDNKPINYKWENNVLSLIQDTEIETGMQKVINIKIASENKIEFTYRIYNKNLWPIEFAPWALTLMAKTGRAIIPQEPYESWDDNLFPVRPLVLWAYTKMNDKRWVWGEKYIQLKQDPGAIGPPKIGLLNKLGWEAYCLDGFVLIKRYSYRPDFPYPDFNCNTQVYSDPDLFELETLGPLEKVDPDSYVEHKENWYLFEAEINEDEMSIDKNLLPLINNTDIPE